jgi:hypothetical protein
MSRVAAAATTIGFFPRLHDYVNVKQGVDSLAFHEECDIDTARSNENLRHTLGTIWSQSTQRKRACIAASP